MKPDELSEHMRKVAAVMRRNAESGCMRGQLTPYVRACTRDDALTSHRLLFTRDEGYHSSGWWKNPEYERCYHLSTSAIQRVIYTGIQREPDRKTERAWVEAFFGTDIRLVWAEPPVSPDGKARNVWHWRVFCDPHWQPILPRGEVYGREFTEVRLVERERGLRPKATADSPVRTTLTPRIWVERERPVGFGGWMIHLALLLSPRGA